VTQTENIDEIDAKILKDLLKDALEHRLNAEKLAC
jgi:hypothetical protein